MYFVSGKSMQATNSHWVSLFVFYNTLAVYSYCYVAWISAVKILKISTRGGQLFASRET